MASTMINHCLICYKERDGDNFGSGVNWKENGENEDTCNRFFKLARDYLSLVDDQLQTVTQLLYAEQVCDNCFPLIESFCEMYDQWHYLQQEMNWRLQQIEEVMLKSDDKTNVEFVRYRKRLKIKLSRVGSTIQDFDKHRRQLKGKVVQILKERIPPAASPELPKTRVISHPIDVLAVTLESGAPDIEETEFYEGEVPSSPRVITPTSATDNEYYMKTEPDEEPLMPRTPEDTLEESCWNLPLTTKREEYVIKSPALTAPGLRVRKKKKGGRSYKQNVTSTPQTLQDFIVESDSTNNESLSNRSQPQISMQQVVQKDYPRLEPEPTINVSLSDGQPRTSIPQGRNRAKLIKPASEEEKFLSRTRGNAFTCGVCGKTFTSSGSKSVHQARHFPGKFNCLYCGRTFTRNYDNLRHMKAIHKHNVDT